MMTNYEAANDMGTLVNPDNKLEQPQPTQITANKPKPNGLKQSAVNTLGMTAPNMQPTYQSPVTQADVQKQNSQVIDPATGQPLVSTPLYIKQRNKSANGL